MASSSYGLVGRSKSSRIRPPHRKEHRVGIRVGHLGVGCETRGFYPTTVYKVVVRPLMGIHTHSLSTGESTSERVESHQAAEKISKMFAKLVVLSFVVVAVLAAPTPGGHHKHVTIHVPYKVHTIHHHHVSKVPIYKEVHVPVVKEVPVIKEVPIIKHVPVPVVKHIEVEKKVFVPIHVKEEHHGWESEPLHGWH